MTMRVFFALLLALTACSDDPAGSGETAVQAPDDAPDSPDAPNPGETCVPSETQWERVIKPMVVDHCSSCHGEIPDYGAPYGLLDYGALVAGDAPGRAVDQIALRMGELTMPPPSRAQPPHGVSDTLAEWASCGAVHPDHSKLIEASADVLGAPDDPPADAEAFNLTALDYAVGPDVLDLYQCFVFEAPIDAPRFARRFDMVVGESRVLHHLVLYRDNDKTGPATDHTCYSVGADFDFLYAWAPGQDSFQFPEGGLRIEPGDRFVVQVHYNNGAAIDGVRDNSGVRVWHSPPQGTEYGMFAPGPLNFSVAPGERKEVVGDCEVRAPVTLLGGFPHMHGIGRGFRQEILRADGSVTPLIELTGWSFESQLIYDTPATLQVGDTLRTTCVFDNPHDEPVRAGPRTSDEMCFNFLYATPPPPTQFCDTQVVEADGELQYDEGECADDGALADLDKVGGAYKEASPPALAGGDLVDGRYVLQEYALYLPTFDLGFGVLDADDSAIEAFGQLLVSDGRTMLDMTSRVVITMTSGTSFPRDTKTSVGGTLAPAADPATLTITPDCGETEAYELQYEVEGDSLTIQRTIRPFGTPLTPWMKFVRLP